MPVKLQTSSLLVEKKAQVSTPTFKEYVTVYFVTFA